MVQAHLFITGYVQGVGYRYFVRNNARRLGLNGWTRNTSDNRVEAVFQGYKEKIEEMIGLCRKGPFLAEVKDIEVEWEEGEEKFKEFTVR